MWFVASFTSMIWAAYATYCESFDRSTRKSIPKLVTPTDGRRVVYLYSMPCLALGSFGVSRSRSVPELLFWRAFQATGTSASLTTGMAIIGDIYRLEERGTAVGITWGVRLFIGASV